MKTISISAYAKKKGVSRQRIQNLIGSGVLTKERGGIDPVKADRALKQSLDPTRESKIKGLGRASERDRKTLLAEKIRLTSAEAGLKELKLSEESGRLIDLGALSRVMDKMHLTFRARVLSRSAKMAPILFACESLVELQTALKDSDWECLSELASIDPESIPDIPAEGV
jgi:phage terminase Nu1 subunit (DNA packaging protein)